MRINTERTTAGVGRLKMYLRSTGQGLTYTLLLPERMMETPQPGIKTKLNDHELNKVYIEFQDSRELNELITVLTSFRDQVEAGLGRWENDWR